MNQSKAAVQSLGVTGPLFAILVIALGMAGIDVSADVAGAPERIASIIDNALVLFGIAVGIFGRIKAKAQITGLLKAK